MSIQSINHVQLPFPAGAEAPIRRFYSSLLGLPEVRLNAGNALRFVAGTQRIDLLQAELPLVENRALPGYLRFYVKDPAGNQLEFLEPDNDPQEISP